MTIPRTRNSYLHFGGKIKRKRKSRKKYVKRKRGQKGGTVFGPMLASTIAPLATNLLNGIVGKLF